MIVKPDSYVLYTSSSQQYGMAVLNKGVHLFALMDFNESNRTYTTKVNKLSEIILNIEQYSVYSSWNALRSLELILGSYEIAEQRDLNELRSLVKLNSVLDLPIVDSNFNLLI